MELTHPAKKSHTQQNTEDSYSYRKKLFILIAIFSAVKLILAFALELGNDEAYYWLYSQYLQWNYFDHPPLIAVWIRLFTANLLLDQYEGFVRLGSVIGGMVSTLFLFKAVSLVHSARAGFFAAVLYNISFYSGVTAGLYVLPDAPQMVFWTFALLLIARITKDENSWRHWLFFGTVVGLCIMSKVHGAFLWIGMGGYILFLKNSWIRKPQVYFAFLLTIVIISPIIFWNIYYDFATFRFHSNRVDVDELSFQWICFLKELGSQVGFNNPVNFYLAVVALIGLFRKRLKYQPALAIYVLIGVPLAFLLLFISLFRDVTLPHWSGPAYVSAIPVAAVWLAHTSKKVFPNVLKWGIGIFLFAYLGYAIVIKFYPGTYGSQKVDDFGSGDVTLDMYGWRKASVQFDSLYRDDVIKNKMPANATMVTPKWWGAHIEYYFAHPPGLKTIGLGDPRYLNEYLWTNKWRRNETDLNNAYCIVPADDKYPVPFDFFQRNELALIISVNRAGKPAHKFRVYRLQGLKKEVPVVTDLLR